MAMPGDQKSPIVLSANWPIAFAWLGAGLLAPIESVVFAHGGDGIATQRTWKWKSSPLDFLQTSGFYPIH